MSGNLGGHCRSVYVAASKSYQLANLLIMQQIKTYVLLQSTVSCSPEKFIRALCQFKASSPSQTCYNSHYAIKEDFIKAGNAGYICKH